MIFTNEDAVLYICRYLCPDDIAALARADRCIRATIIPHMRYVVKTTTIMEHHHKIIRKDITCRRFARVDTIFILPSVYVVRLDIIPRDYTGLISIEDEYVYAYDTHVYLWVSAGLVYREMFWDSRTNAISIVKIDLVPFDDLIHKRARITYRIDPDENRIRAKWQSARRLNNCNLSNEFRNRLCFDLA